MVLSCAQNSKKYTSKCLLSSRKSSELTFLLWWLNEHEYHVFYPVQYSALVIWEPKSHEILLLMGKFPEI